MSTLSTIIDQLQLTDAELIALRATGCQLSNEQTASGSVYDPLLILGYTEEDVVPESLVGDVEASIRRLLDKVVSDVVVKDYADFEVFKGDTIASVTSIPLSIETTACGVLFAASNFCSDLDRYIPPVVEPSVELSAFTGKVIESLNLRCFFVKGNERVRHYRLTVDGRLYTFKFDSTIDPMVTQLNIERW